MRRLTSEQVADILAGVRAGKTVQIVSHETGVAASTIRYHIARAGIVIEDFGSCQIASRYPPRGALYWRRKMSGTWKRMRMVRASPPRSPLDAHISGSLRSARWGDDFEDILQIDKP